VPFSVHEAQRFHAGSDRLAPGARGQEAVADEGGRERVSALDHAERDLGLRGEEGETQRTPGRAQDAHDRAGGDARGARHVALEDPGMTRTHAALAAFADYDRQVGHRAIVSSFTPGARLLESL